MSDAILSAEDVRAAIREARRLSGMLQATMGLEGQGLDRAALRRIRKRMVRRLLRLNVPGPLSPG